MLGTNRNRGFRLLQQRDEGNPGEQRSVPSLLVSWVDAGWVPAHVLPIVHRLALQTKLEVRLDAAVPLTFGHHGEDSTRLVLCHLSRRVSAPPLNVPQSALRRTRCSSFVDLHLALTSFGHPPPIADVVFPSPSRDLPRGSTVVVGGPEKLNPTGTETRLRCGEHLVLYDVAVPSALGRVFGTPRAAASPASRGRVSGASSSGKQGVDPSTFGNSLGR